MADDDRPLPGRTESTEAVHIRTFLIADVRGYTLFTQERGDEAATKLAARFAEVAREVVEEHGGSVIELRGDEALAAFNSARQAILAAAHAQDRFLEETVADPSFPLPVGIGLDAGEAVPLEAGYRGGALNLAARLCGRAGPGEILASQGVVHLARKVEGVRYVDRGDLHLKGLAEPVRVFRVISEEGDPAVRFRELAPGRPPGGLCPDPPGAPASGRGARGGPRARRGRRGSHHARAARRRPRGAGRRRRPGDDRPRHRRARGIGPARVEARRRRRRRGRGVGDAAGSRGRGARSIRRR